MRSNTNIKKWIRGIIKGIKNGLLYQTGCNRLQYMHEVQILHMLYLCKLHNPWLHRQYRNISTKLTKNDASPIPPRTTKYKTNLVIGKTNHKNQCLNDDTFCNLDNTLTTCPILWTSLYENQTQNQNLFNKFVHINVDITQLYIVCCASNLPDIQNIQSGNTHFNTESFCKESILY